MLQLLVTLVFLVALGNTQPCIPQNYGGSSIVCVCNATYCDQVGPVEPPIPPKEHYYDFVSSKSGLRLNLTRGKFVSPNDANQRQSAEVRIVLDSSITFQKIFGFGGAFTDAAGINIKKLSNETQMQLIRAYFDQENGSRYNFARVPIAGTDFSTKPYTYDDLDEGVDVSLRNFALAPEDYNYKIPLMQEALKLNPNIKVFAAAWSAPAWMKTNGKITGPGFLKSEYYQVWADYLVKFVGEYTKHGIPIWAISTGNEPIDVFIPLITFNKMGWLPGTQGKFVSENLGPTLARSVHNATRIMVLDDQRFNLPWFISGIFNVKGAEKYTSFIAVHWYWDRMIPTKNLDMTHQRYPDKPMILTEACTGAEPPNINRVLLGSWERGEAYALNIIQNLEHWMSGWVDWNLALDRTGGPNWVGNFVDSSIIVMPETDEFVKQPMYYAIQHFSKFVKPDSRRISTSKSDEIKSIAFVTPDDEVVIILYNRHNTPRSVAIDDANHGTIYLELPPFSLHTVIYRK